MKATTEPASSSGQPSAPKTLIVVNARRNNEKSFNIIALCNNQNARSLWAAIKARFGGNKESKKMQKNLLKQQFETFVVGAREVARLRHTIDPVFINCLLDCILMPKVYEHELKGASSSNSQSIAFMSAEIKGSTSRQSTANDNSEIITKGYTQASSSKLKETLNSSLNSDEIICSFFAQQASIPETHDDEDLLQIDDDYKKGKKIIEPHGSRSRIQGSDSKKKRVSVHVVCAWVLDLYYGVHRFDSFTGGLFMAV
ncbi:hypothetical protein Tco_0389821 [Tanacetum coccineum]